MVLFAVCAVVWADFFHFWLFLAAMSDHSLRVSLCAENRVQLLPANKGSSWRIVRMKTGHLVWLFVALFVVVFFFSKSLYENGLFVNTAWGWEQLYLWLFVSVWKRYSVLFPFGELQLVAFFLQPRYTYTAHYIDVFRVFQEYRSFPCTTFCTLLFNWSGLLRVTRLFWALWLFLSTTFRSTSDERTLIFDGSVLKSRGFCTKLTFKLDSIDSERTTEESFSWILCVQYTAISYPLYWFELSYEY